MDRQSQGKLAALSNEVQNMMGGDNEYSGAQEAVAITFAAGTNKILPDATIYFAKIVVLDNDCLMLLNEGSNPADADFDPPASGALSVNSAEYLIAGKTYYKYVTGGITRMDFLAVGAAAKVYVTGQDLPTILP